MLNGMLGLLQDQLGYQQILQQEGIIYKLLAKMPSEYPAPIIVNRPLDSQEILNARNFLHSGGCIITDFPNLKGIIPAIRYQISKIPFIYGETDLFHNIQIIDLKLKGYRLTKGQNVFEGEYGKGYIIALPFDVNQAILDTRNELKPFYFPHRKFPYERVAVVNKGEVRKLVVNCLKKLYRKMNLPYVHLWYYPNTFQSAFSFRIDTDFAPDISLRTTVNLSQISGIEFTYFINTSRMPDIHIVHNKDVQIHCFHHKVFQDYKRNFDNIKTAKTILEKNGFHPIGFVSPFGMWNRSLQYAMETCDLKYSSEFSLSYDDFPFFPVLDNKNSSLLQIPVHPICIGRLLQAGLSDIQCRKYYEDYITTQHLTNEMIFIYDHPHRIHQFLALFSAVLDKVKALSNLWITTMTEFYYWWIKRLEVYKSSQWQIQNNLLKIETEKSFDNIFLHIITPNTKEAFVPMKKGNYHLSDLSYQPLKQMSKQKDIAKILYTKSTKAKIQTLFYETIKQISKIGK
ncbi:MAG: hypothetical protein N2201_06475 [candidate division WOR-3 bacterium]|nr:hypothetical protein [candidate division WOR-3 bacterium]